MSPLPSRPQEGIDHAVIAVRDLDRAEAQYRRLGFDLTPRGHHTRLGSYNHCAMFSEDYLELIASGTVSRPFLERFLKLREGLSGIAFRTRDARATNAKLRAEGFNPADPVEFGRPVKTATRSGNAHFVTTEVDTNLVHGTRVFFCQHDTPELVWLPEYQRHANGVQALRAITLIDESGEVAATYRRLLGRPMEPIADGQAIVMGAQRLEFLTRATAERRYPGEPLLAFPPPFAAGLRFAVADRAATARRLREAGIELSEGADGALFVRSLDAVGAVLEFE
ncbi:MAG TPA: VOC family protein [Stellaceae bacterium]|nr:VOC family protein [Stellaceae bacterium]